MAISEQLQMSGCGPTESAKSQCFPQGSRANHTAWREKVAAMVTSVTCGTRLHELSQNFARAGFSAKILPVCSPALVSGTSHEFLPTLTRWGIACRGEFGAHVMSEHRTKGKGCSLLPTPNTSGMDGGSNSRKARGGNVMRFVEKFPTPCASGWGNEGSRNILKKQGICGKEYNQMIQGNGGKLNPAWVEWLMGFPIGWTDLGASATP